MNVARRGPGRRIAGGADSLVAFGTGPLFALGTGLVVGSVAPERAGSAAALAEVSNYLGSTVGITVFGTLAAATYQSRLGNAAPAARESIARATLLAHTAGGASGQQLLHRAHSGFGTVDAPRACGLVPAEER